MSVVHTLLGARPPARVDAEPWVSARVEESATEDGTYTVLTTITFDPVDDDPAKPQRRNLTFESALAQAWYRLVFVDTDGDTSPPTDPVFDDGESAAVPWQPSVEDVAALLRARTKELGGNEAGTFNDATRPTRAEAERLILLATRKVISRVGVSPCTDELREDAGGAAATYAAMLIEQSYYPEQTTNAGSSFQSLRSLWGEDIKALVEAVGEQCGGGDGEAVGGTGQLGSAMFDDLPLIGRLGPEW